MQEGHSHTDTVGTPHPADPSAGTTVPCPPSQAQAWAGLFVCPNLTLLLGKALSGTWIRSKGKSSPLTSSSCPGAEWNHGSTIAAANGIRNLQWCWKLKVRP